MHYAHFSEYYFLSPPPDNLQCVGKVSKVTTSIPPSYIRTSGIYGLWGFDSVVLIMITAWIYKKSIQLIQIPTNVHNS